MLFGRVLAPGMLFCGGDHAQAAARIGHGIGIRGITVITGEVGLGPTATVVGRPCLTTGAHEVGRSSPGDRGRWCCGSSVLRSSLVIAGWFEVILGEGEIVDRLSTQPGLTPRPAVRDHIDAAPGAGARRSDQATRNHDTRSEQVRACPSEASGRNHHNPPTTRGRPASATTHT
jgi:hypothetical protein